MFHYNVKHFNLLRELTVSQLRSKDASSLLGIIWSFLNPLLFLLVVFVMFNLRFQGSIENYGIYVLIGIVQYTHFSNCTVASMTVLKNMGQLTGQTLFPKELLIFSIILSRTYEFVIALGITIMFAYIAGVGFSFSILALPFVLLLQISLVLWVSLVLSWIYLLARDIQHIFQVFLRLLIFICPIFYPPSFVEGNFWAELIIFINPLTHLINFSRTIIISGELFSATAFCWLLLINSILIYLSFITFKRVEPRFGELL